ncbi:serine/threonine-protein kinase [Actinomycetes bacterium KLBMP 9759]
MAVHPLVDHDPQRIGGYRIVGRLGAGGMGQVFLGEDADGRQVAVKVVHPGLAHDQRFRQRFRREVEVSRQVSGPWVAAVVDADADAAVPWLATEYVPGPSLTDVLDRYGELEPAVVRRLGHGLASALITIHAAGLVHRDIKPSNVLMAEEGPRLIDFGISRAVDATRMTGTGAVIGTPGYMSPEQVDGHEAGPASDIFSLGALLAYAAGGRHPFGEATPVVLMLRISRDAPDLGDVPASLRRTLAACLAKRPEDRPSAAELARELRPPRQTVVATAVAPSVAGTAEPSVTAEPPVAAEPSVADGELPDSLPARIGRRAVIVAGGLLVAGGATAAIAALVDPTTIKGDPTRTVWETEADLGPLAVDIASVYVYGSSAVSALDRRSGEPRWRADAVDRAAGLAPSISVQGDVVIAVGRSALVAYDARTGQRRWSRPLDGTTTSNVVAADGVVVASTPEALVGLDAGSGAQLWSADIRFELVSHGLHAHGGSCAVSRTDTATVELRDLRTGRVRWSQDVAGSSTCAELRAGPGPVSSAHGNTVRALDPDTGRPRWTRSLAVQTVHGRDSGDVVVLTRSGLLLALDGQTGEQRWSATSPGSEVLDIDGGTIRVATALGGVVAHHVTTGAQIWAASGNGSGGVAVYGGMNVLFEPGPKPTGAAPRGRLRAFTTA